MSEEHLYEQLAQYLRLKHPGLIFHFDLSGLWTPSKRLRNLYGRLNKRAWPDLFIATKRSWAGEIYDGLFIELKREGVKLRKRDGSWVSPHVAEQAALLDRLAEQNYIAQFAVGFDEAVQVIESYLEPYDDI